ncbi:uncharacterized protein [Diabrotica undecimpunctata]|uniref:uncharacterized protein n=1 Tax=Diabrotica undecimpunctata TaxID=50387 RepID=UPI003B63285B
MNQNQLLITLVVVASFALEGYCAAAPEGPKNVTIKDYCIKETGISPDKVKKIEEDSEEEVDEQGYCYVHCIFVSMDLIDSKGKLDVKKTMEAFDDMDEECLKKVPKIMECTDMAALDDCEK